MVLTIVTDNTRCNKVVIFDDEVHTFLYQEIRHQFLTVLIRIIKKSTIFN